MMSVCWQCNRSMTNNLMLGLHDKYMTNDKLCIIAVYVGFFHTSFGNLDLISSSWWRQRVKSKTVFLIKFESVQVTLVRTCWCLSLWRSLYTWHVFAYKNNNNNKTLKHCVFVDTIWVSFLKHCLQLYTFIVASDTMIYFQSQGGVGKVKLKTVPC